MIDTKVDVNSRRRCALNSTVLKTKRPRLTSIPLLHLSDPVTLWALSLWAYGHEPTSMRLRVFGAGVADQGQHAASMPPWLRFEH